MTNEAEPTTYLPDPANDETLTMTGYEWWRYRRAIEAEARAESAAKVRALTEALEWAIRELRGAVGYRHPPECSPLTCVCGYRKAADVLDAALAAPAPSEPDCTHGEASRHGCDLCSCGPHSAGRSSSA